MEKKLTTEFTIEELNLILGSLSEMPYKHVHTLFNRLVGEANALAGQDAPAPNPKGTSEI